MARCKRISVPKRKYCSGDLRHFVSLSDRELTTPDFNSPDFGQNLNEPATNTLGSIDAWAAIKTVRGSTIFDDTGVEIDVTHEIVVRYDSAFQFKTLVLYEGQVYRVLDAENLDQDNEWLVLRCTDRGKQTRPAAFI